MHRHRLGSRLRWGAVALLAAAFLARLGVWQLSRAHEKVAQADRVAERGRQPPLSSREITRDPSAAPSQWERHVEVHGHWAPVHPYWLMNRTMDGASGFYVLMPLVLDDGRWLMVQRGFEAAAPGQAVTPPPLAPLTGDAVVRGHLAPWPAHRLELGAAASGPVRQNLTPDAVRAETGHPPGPLIVVEDANAANAGDGLVRHWVQPTISSAVNYGYAAQWFAMSATVLALYVWLQFIRPATARSTDDA